MPAVKDLILEGFTQHCMTCKLDTPSDSTFILAWVLSLGGSFDHLWKIGSQAGAVTPI